MIRMTFARSRHMMRNDWPRHEGSQARLPEICVAKRVARAAMSATLTPVTRDA
jgi:hypothetical protein